MIVNIDLDLHGVVVLHIVEEEQQTFQTKKLNKGGEKGIFSENNSIAVTTLSSMLITG